MTAARKPIDIGFPSITLSAGFVAIFTNRLGGPVRRSGSWLS